MKSQDESRDDERDAKENAHRRIRQRVDEFLKGHKHQLFTVDELATSLDMPGGAFEIAEALTAAVRCPYASCKSFDTRPLTELRKSPSQVYSCNRCGRNFNARVDAHGRMSIVGWYGE